MNEFLDAAVWFLNVPGVRALTAVISVISFALSLWALRKFRDFTETNRRHFAADHARFVDDQWQRSNHVILSNREHLHIMAELLSYKDADEALRAYLIFNMINPLYSAFNSVKQGIMDKAVFEAAMGDFASHFSGDRSSFLSFLRSRGYTDEFVDRLNMCLPKPNRSEKLQQSAPLCGVQ
jgi:hypothetical protein